MLAEERGTVATSVVASGVLACCESCWQRYSNRTRWEVMCVEGLGGGGVPYVTRSVPQDCITYSLLSPHNYNQLRHLSILCRIQTRNLPQATTDPESWYIERVLTHKTLCKHVSQESSRVFTVSFINSKICWMIKQSDLETLEINVYRVPFNNSGNGFPH